MIAFERVSKRYGGQAVLDRFSLDLGETGGVCLFGPSGCGKTTALRILAGLEEADEGRVTGMAGKRVAMHFQENRLLPWRTLRQNLALVLPGGDGSAEDWLARVRLSGDGFKYPGELSGGMRRRASLARALAFRGDVLLLDEPFRELDAATREAMIELVRKEAEGRLLVLVTHNRGEAERLCGRVVEMGPGVSAL